MLALIQQHIYHTIYFLKKWRKSFFSFPSLIVDKLKKAINKNSFVSWKTHTCSTYYFFSFSENCKIIPVDKFIVDFGVVVLNSVEVAKSSPSETPELSKFLRRSITWKKSFQYFFREIKIFSITYYRFFSSGKFIKFTWWSWWDDKKSRSLPRSFAPSRSLPSTTRRPNREARSIII